MDKKVGIIVCLFLFLISCSKFKVGRGEIDTVNTLNKTIIFLDHTGDTIIKCKTNEIPEFNMERLVGKDSRTYYVKLDSTEYLESSADLDMVSIVIWQIKKRK